MKTTNARRHPSLERFIAEEARIEAHEERPLDADEREAIVRSIADSLGWPRERVLAEAMLQLHAKVSSGGEFHACTPEPLSLGARRARIRILLARTSS